MSCFLMNLMGVVFTAIATLAGGAERSSVPNPSASKCLDLGGEYIGFAGERGQFAMCSIDGAAVGAWTLYRATVEPRIAQMATDFFLSHPPVQWPGCSARVPCVGMPNPAAYYCGQLGGEYQTYLSTDIYLSVSVCEFADSSLIDAWVLLAGAESHRVLADLLAVYPN